MELYPTDEQYKKYWNQESKTNDKRVNAAINPIFLDANDKIMDNLLDLLNKRKYSKIEDNKVKARKMKSDPNYKNIDEIIKGAGVKSLNALYKNQPIHYYEEVPQVAKYLYPWTLETGSIKPSKLSDNEIYKLNHAEYEGNTYKYWINTNTDTALKSWHNNFNKVMKDDLPSKESRLIKAVRSATNAQKNKNKTVMKNALIEASRKAQKDFEASIWA